MLFIITSWKTTSKQTVQLEIIIIFYLSKPLKNISLLVKKGILLTCQTFQLLSLITSAKIKPAVLAEGLEMVIKITLTRLEFIPSEIVA